MSRVLETKHRQGESLEMKGGGKIRSGTHLFIYTIYSNELTIKISRQTWKNRNQYGMIARMK